MIGIAFRWLRHAVPKLRSIAAIPLGLSLACLAHTTQAFESREHLRMSNAALKTAIGFVKKTLPQNAERTLAVEAACKLLQPPASGPNAQKGCESELSLDQGQYGTLTACVDYFLFPEKMLAFAWRPSRSHAAIYISKSVLPDGRETSVHPALMSQCQKEGANFIQASHSNHAHFQQDLIISIRLYHALARGIASNEGNPYAALVVNAISDHYLQDFFAPGHLVTPRDRLTDLPATAMHDLANQMGAIFVPNAEPIADILTYLCGVEGKLQSSPNVPLVCAPSEQVTSVLSGIGIPAEKLGPIVEDIVGGKRILFRGDGQLGATPQDAQRLLLLAVQTRSIVDILEGKNSFLEFSFDYQLDEGKPTASTPFGRYEFHEHGKKIEPILAGNATPLPANSARRRSSGTQSSVFSVCSFGSCEDKLYRLRDRSPILSVSFQRESEDRGSHEGRNVWALEFSPWGRNVDLSGPSRGYLTGVEIVPAFGYLHYRHGGRSGHGPSLRVPFYVPETEFSFGPYARLLDYPDRNGNSRKLSYGLRMDAGFSTYATFFLGFGSDYANDGSGQLTKTWMWSAGLRLGFPLSRIEFWNR